MSIVKYQQSTWSREQYLNLVTIPSSGHFFYSPGTIIVDSNLLKSVRYNNGYIPKVFTLCSRPYKMVMSYYVIGLIGCAFRIWPVTGAIYQTIADKTPQALSERWIIPLTYDEVCAHCGVGTINAILVPPDVNNNQWTWDAGAWFLVSQFANKV